jgi:hypothetical protein
MCRVQESNPIGFIMGNARSTPLRSGLRVNARKISWMTTIPPISSPWAHAVNQTVGPAAPDSAASTGKQRRARSEPVKMRRRERRILIKPGRCGWLAGFAGATERIRRFSDFSFLSGWGRGGDPDPDGRFGCRAPDRFS